MAALSHALLAQGSSSKDDCMRAMRDIMLRIQVQLNAYRVPIP